MATDGRLSSKLQPAVPAPRSILPIGIGLPIGTPAPEFSLPGITGQKRSLGSLLEQGKTIFLVFSSPYCESCQALLPNISRWMREHKESLNFKLCCRHSRHSQGESGETEGF
jgi:thiol-disulfide isomerase/thioredoxin